MHSITTTTQLDQLLAKGDVVIDFWAEWCGPCRLLNPVVEKLAAKYEDVQVVKVNVDEAPELASKYRILSIPTVMRFHDGEPTATSVGAMPLEALERRLGLIDTQAPA